MSPVAAAGAAVRRMRRAAPPWRGPAVARSAPERLQTADTVDRLLLSFVAASLPAVAIGLWNVGAEARALLALEDGGNALLGWRGAIAEAAAGIAGPHVGNIVLGVGYFAPLLVVAALAAGCWQAVFARVRGRSMDASWLAVAWLFAALLPPSTPLPLAAVGISFGFVLGSEVFGGVGRYLVSPALLGVVYLNFAHPELFAGAEWLPPLEGDSTWSRLAAGGVESVIGAGEGWRAVFAGREAGTALGSSSALACLLGAAFLAWRGAVSWRTLGGALAGLALLAVALGGSADAAIPWHWHAAVGGFAFGVAFVATDPTTLPLTRSARWAHGFLIGALTVLMRVMNPDHIDGTLFAILLASLTVPLLDHVAVRISAWSYARSVAR